MPRQKPPNLARLRKAPADTGKRGVCVLTPKDVGDVVRVARARTLGKQADAAQRLGVSRTMLGGLERGEGGSQLNLTLSVLADLGFDLVLVPRDPSRAVRGSGDA